MLDRFLTDHFRSWKSVACSEISKPIPENNFLLPKEFGFKLQYVSQGWAGSNPSPETCPGSGERDLKLSVIPINFHRGNRGSLNPQLLFWVYSFLISSKDLFSLSPHSMPRVMQRPNFLGGNFSWVFKLRSFVLCSSVHLLPLHLLRTPRMDLRLPSHSSSCL